METQNKTYCVYIHINKQNRKVYIGQTKFGDNPNKRWRNGEGYIMSVVFYQAIKKYGWDGFEHKVIASGLTQDEANHLEESLIQQFDSTNFANGYNIKSGGENYEWSDIAKLKMVKSLRETIRERHRVDSEENLRERFNQNDPAVRECTRCGVLFEIKHGHKRLDEKRNMGQNRNKNLPRICPDCRNDDNNKPNNVIKTCIDCGTEFICSVFATMKVRCDECQNIINKKRRSTRSAKYYSSHKN